MKKNETESVKTEAATRNEIFLCARDLKIPEKEMRNFPAAFKLCEDTKAAFYKLS